MQLAFPIRTLFTIMNSVIVRQTTVYIASLSFSKNNYVLKILIVN